MVNMMVRTRVKTGVVKVSTGPNAWDYNWVPVYAWVYVSVPR